METKTLTLLNGNQATAHMAYMINEVCPLYPITPSSEMSELVEAWSAEERPNIYGDVPMTFEMQSEGGVAGAMHGALQAGSLSTTFTASQGLLLMQPNMYKIAGELNPNVIHVATRSIATHGLSVFGDHSDIMAVRNTGYAFLGAASVQETMDFTLIAQVATLESRIPFVHFFDGFRTSHETTGVTVVPNSVIRKMMPSNKVMGHRNNALNPNSPVIRGTSQESDVFFQSREAVNQFYTACPETVQRQMDKFAVLTGRHYHLFDYVGHPEAEEIIIAMASATETIAETVTYLNTKGAKVGVVKVRLFRPFSVVHFLKALPKSCRAIAVLDRTKEPGATGEPLYLDILQAISAMGQFDNFPKIVGGRYGLSSKEFNPKMVKSIFNNLKQEFPKNSFTIGIHDDITHLSLKLPNDFQWKDTHAQILFYENKSLQGTTSFQQLLAYIADTTSYTVQGYVECDYKKSNSRSVANLRIGKEDIKAPYLISNADSIICDSLEFVENDNVLERLRCHGTLLVNSTLSPDEFLKALSIQNLEKIKSKQLTVYTINTTLLSSNYALETHTICGLHYCLFAINDKIAPAGDLTKLKTCLTKIDTNITNGQKETVQTFDEAFTNTLLGQLLAHKGNEVPVSALPIDGTYETNTSHHNKRKPPVELPLWNQEVCTQCGACSMTCPQGSLRIKAYDTIYLDKAPVGMKSVRAMEVGRKEEVLQYTIQIHPDQCTACHNCVDACGEGALVMTDRSDLIENEKTNWDYFKTLPEFDRTKIDPIKMAQQQLQEPLFKYAMGVEGCGEAPYLKLLSQLFGDRLLIANATGASSIFGGALPTTPWSKNTAGKGPAWSNSLFEDNAEFGLGFRLSIDQKEVQAKTLLKHLRGKLDRHLVYAILNADQSTEKEIIAQRDRIENLKIQLQKMDFPEAKKLLELVDNLVKQSVWIIGGDGWAYDIGYGGLDHVMASGKNVNILVLDNEVYSNTGGQMSKATPFGATAKFAAHGKRKQKKDLGQLAMVHEGVYVASVAMGADKEHTLKAFIEAENYNGPSIIIAYCHSPAHGIDMKKPGQYHKAAVHSGQWLLYRNDPRRSKLGLGVLQLDSKTPDIPIEAYLRMEERFARLFEKDSKTFEVIIGEIQQKINKKYTYYLDRAIKGNKNM